MMFGLPCYKTKAQTVMVNNGDQYQQNKESLNSNGQQCDQYQQNKESLNSNGQQCDQYQQNEQS